MNGQCKRVVTMSHCKDEGENLRAILCFPKVSDFPCQQGNSKSNRHAERLHNYRCLEAYE